jgi:23S rRNA pseudouridine1911/1915/1917 synthase
MKMKIDILFEDNHVLVVKKPKNMPTQADESKDRDLHSVLKDYIKETRNKTGNVYLGMVHRLDRPTSGLMVFAKTSKSASRLSEQIRKGEFEKTYLALFENFSLPSEGTLEDCLIQSEEKIVVDEKGKKSILDYNVLKTKNNISLVEINLKTGRKHQIRVQFSSRGNPVMGDGKYGNKNQKTQNLMLMAYKLSFEHPTTKEKLTFEIDVNEEKEFKI